MLRLVVMPVAANPSSLVPDRLESSACAILQTEETTIRLGDPHQAPLSVVIEAQAIPRSVLDRYQWDSIGVGPTSGKFKDLPAPVGVGEFIAQRSTRSEAL